MLLLALPMVSSTSWRADPSGEKPTCTFGSATTAQGSPSRAVKATYRNSLMVLALQWHGTQKPSDFPAALLAVTVVVVKLYEVVVALTKPRCAAAWLRLTIVRAWFSASIKRPSVTSPSM